MSISLKVLIGLFVLLLLFWFLPTFGASRVSPLPPAETLEIERTATFEAEQYQPLSPHEIIIKTAKNGGVNPDVALAIAKCESGLNPLAVGDGGQSRGLWQIHRPSWPEITDAQAFDPEWSTAWAVEKLKSRPAHWTCWRILGRPVL